MKTWLSLLAICVLLGGLLSGTHLLTQPQIAANRSAAERAALTTMLAPQPLPAELKWEQGYLPVCRRLTLQRLQTNGYGGPMTMLITYQSNSCDLSLADDVTQTQCSQPTVHKLAVVEHSETPGIGDFFETTQPDWLQQLGQLANTPELVDSVSGATITVAALRNTVFAALNVGTAIPFNQIDCKQT